jgi:ribosomal protein L20
MSKKTELAVFEKTIAIAGVRVTRTAMEFATTDAETLRDAGAFLQAVDACSAWWWGDFLAAYCGYEIKAEEDENGPMDELTRGDKLKQYSAKYAVIANREPKTLWQYLWVARFYNSSCRQEQLTWTHHVEATVGADGDLAKAQEWLDAAIKHRWSSSELRAAIRKAKRADEADADGPEAQSLLPIELTNCRRWASAAIHRVDDMDVEEARAHLAELEQVHAYIVALTRRVSPSLSILPAERGKESFSA